MKKTAWLHLIFIVSITLSNCSGQADKSRTTIPEDYDTSSPFYYGMPDDVDAEDISPGWNQEGQRILLTGTVFQVDGKTPAPDILMYYYQTNTNGRYIHKEDVDRSIPPNSRGQSHGYIRGWVKTDKHGNYAIYTIRPGSYPSGDEAEHVHISIKEPGLEDHYYIDDFVFDDDVHLTTTRRKRMENRGGTGVINLVKKGDLHVGKRNIILGLNIPEYR